jgi:hypothetical protein
VVDEYESEMKNKSAKTTALRVLKAVPEPIDRSVLIFDQPLVE